MASQQDEISQFFEELYVARTKDTGEQPSKEEFLRFRTRIKPRVTGPIAFLRNQHFGSQCANCLSKYLRNRSDLEKVDLYSNVLRDQGLQTISNLLLLNPAIQILNVGCNDISDKSGATVYDLLHCKHLRSLQLGLTDKGLHPNRFTSFSLDQIADAVVKNNTLIALGLNSALYNKKLTIAPPLSIPLIKLISRAKSLRHLSLSNCELDSKSFLEIIDKGFHYNSTLLRLDVSSNNLSAEVGIRLAEFLLSSTKVIEEIPQEEEKPPLFQVKDSTEIPHVFYLDASNNNFGSAVARAFQTVLLFHPFLGYLDLSGNNLGDDGAITLSKRLIDNSTLIELHLASNQITQLGGSAIMKSLFLNSSLLTLDLSTNKLAGDFSSVVADFFIVNSTLVTLKLASATLTNENGIQILRATRHSPSLLYLDMANNFFTEGAGFEMEKMVDMNKVILKVDVSGTQINHFSLKTIEGFCQRNQEILKQVENKPLRNLLVKSQYSTVELQRKEVIMGNLTDQRIALEDEITELRETIQSYRDENSQTTDILTKQIQEKQQQRGKYITDFEKKKVELTEKIHDFQVKKQNLESRLQNALNATKETKQKMQEKQAEIDKQNQQNTAEKNEKLNEIQKIKDEIDGLLKLAADPSALAELEDLPELRQFEDDGKEDAQDASALETIPATTQTKSKKKKKGKK